MNDGIPMTAAGYERLTKELEHLKSVERPALVAEIEKARTQGYNSPKYLDARDKQMFLEGRISELEWVLPNAKPVPPKDPSGNTVEFGATVDLVDVESKQQKTYQIVGQLEANLEKGMISYISPLAKALLGKKKGDVIEARTSKGIQSFQIVAIRYE